MKAVAHRKLNIQWTQENDSREKIFEDKDSGIHKNLIR
jgi:hypothetical protein